MSLTSTRFLSAIILVCAVASVAPAQATVPVTRSQAVRPGDVLRLRIWREPDMSGDYPVNADGDAVLPRLGQLRVSAIPADSIQPVLVEKYRVYLNNPSIEVLLLRRISITGAVRNPGVYPVDPTLTVSEALDLAGGPAPDGKRDRVEIRRRGERILADLRTDAVVANSPLESGDQLYVPTRAWLSRNTWLISGAVTLVAVALRYAIQ